MKNTSICSTIEIAGTIEVLHARYSGHAFSPHWHEEFAIGLIDTGVEQFEYQGGTYRAAEGEIVLLNSGEVHTGEAFDERGFGFRMLYIPETTFKAIVTPESTPNGSFQFRSAILDSRTARLNLLAAHRSLEDGSSSLERESRFITAIARVISEASSWSLPKKLLSAPAAILRARDYLHEHLFEDVRLSDLAAMAQISKFHLLRGFRDRFGLPPHAYQLQHRIFRAKHLLRVLPPAEVAHHCGFVDQSHLHRVFRALAGTTPGRYAQQFHPIPAIPSPRKLR
jgi:AraC-like DNA-binding protein